MTESIDIKILKLKSQHNKTLKELQNNCRNQYNKIVQSRNSYLSKRNLINNLFAYYTKSLENLKNNLQNRIQELYNSIYSNSHFDSNSDSNSDYKHKKALLIACNYRGTKCELHGCINDTENIKNKLQNSYNFNDIKLLTDDTLVKPTLNNIINELKNLLNNAVAGDVLFVSFSGHGTFMTDQNNDEKDGKDEMFITLDMKYIRDDEMKQFIQGSLKKDVKLFMLFDCCHSGSMLDLKYQYLDSTDLDKNTITNNTETVGDVYMVSGCMDNQTSMGAYIDGEIQGAMSWALVKTLNENSNISWGELLTKMRKCLASSQFKQIPQLSSGRQLDLNEKICL